MAMEWRNLLAGGVALAAFHAADAQAIEISLTAISTPFNSPIGIDYFEPTNQVILSVNYPSGNPSNFELVAADGSRTAFSTISGLTEELKLATVRSAARGGLAGGAFAAGTTFTGNGNDGEIVKVDPDGTESVFVSLPGSGNGLLRGSLYVDRTGVWNGDLIAVTTSGEVWRVDSAGVPTALASVGTHLEGVITVPNDAARYGALAGKIIIGAENTGGFMYVVDTSGTVTRYNVGVNIEDIDLIPANENFFGVNFGTGRLLGAPASEFADVVGDILLTQEFGGVSGLFVLRWDPIGNAPVAEAITLDANSFRPGQWEHVTFAPAGIREIPPVETPEPASLLLLGLGLVGMGALRRR